MLVYLLRVLVDKKRGGASVLFTGVFWERPRSVSVSKTDEKKKRSLVSAECAEAHQQERGCSPTLKEPLSELLFHGLADVQTLNVLQLFRDGLYSLLVVFLILLPCHQCFIFIVLGSDF